MSEDQQTSEDAPQEAPEASADAGKRSYHPPQVRELGHLADLTGTGPIQPGGFDGSGYTS
jgi:hypothetical protein